MGNYFQKYYHANLAKAAPGRSIKNLMRTQDPYDRSASRDQEKFRKDLVSFLDAKGVDFPIMRKPARNLREASSRINAMITIIKKNGWADEFFSAHPNEGKEEKQ